MKLLIFRISSVGLGTLLGFCLTVTQPSWAVLGDNAASVLADQARMKGTLHSTDRTSYVLHEITLASGDKIREYVSPAGAVFAVAWDSQAPPNFQQLLGPYYQQAQQAAADKAAAQSADVQQPRRRGAPIAIETPTLVFYQGGRPRSFHGQAYIPQLLPQGVTGQRHSLKEIEPCISLGCYLR